MNMQVFASFPCGDNAVAVPLHDIKRVEPQGPGSCIKLKSVTWGDYEEVYSTASVMDAMDIIETTARMAEQAMLRRLRATPAGYTE